MSLMVTSFRGAFVRMLDQRLDAQLYLDAQVGFADADLEALRAAAGSGATLRLERRDIARVAEGNRGIDVEVIHDRGPDAAHRYGHEGELSRDAALVSEPGAQRYGWSAGDTLTLAGDGPPRRVTVAGVFRDYGSPRPRVVVSAEVGDSLFRDAPVRAVAVGNVDGQSRAAVESLAHRSGWRVRRDDEVRTRALDVFARSFRVSDALVVVAVSVAVVGLFNALFAVRLRRQSELRLLAAMGLSRGEQLRMNATYAAMLGVHAIVVALPVGLGIGWLLCRVLNPRAFGWSIPFAADVDAIVTVLGLGLLGATLAGLSTGPGLRLERVDAP
jgi:putative ABC transport system permease protein